MDYVDSFLGITSRVFVAKAIQLDLEHNPRPPLNAGSPETAPIQVKQFVSDMFAGVRKASIELSKKLGIIRDLIGEHNIQLLPTPYLIGELLARKYLLN